MKVNLPGAREGMYMETADSIFVETRNIAVKGDYAFEARGLWEMKNDAMGGPFVCLVVWLVAFGMVWKAARANPTENLKTE